jgi:hypothetical protein
VAARIAALVAAVAMVVGSLAVRDRMNHPNGKSPTGGGSNALAIVCATELGPVCDAIAVGGGATVVIESAAVTEARLRGADANEPGLDAWLAPGPWPQMVDIVRRQANKPVLFRPTLDRVARSPLVLVAWKDQAEKLKTGPECQGTVTSKCVGDAVIAAHFKLGAPDAGDGVGLLVDGALVSGLIGNSDWATNDLDEAAVSGWIAQVDRSVDAARRDGARSLNDLLITHAVANGFVTTEADGGPGRQRAASRDQLDLIYLSPPATADVLLGTTPGSRGDKVRKLLQSDRAKGALQTNGWRVAGRPGVPGVDTTGTPLANDDGLPSAGVLEALEGIVTS